MRSLILVHHLSCGFQLICGIVEIGERGIKYCVVFLFRFRFFSAAHNRVIAQIHEKVYITLSELACIERLLQES